MHHCQAQPVSAPPTSQPRRWRIPLWDAARHSLQFRISLLTVLLLLAVISGGAALSLRATGAAMFESESTRTVQWAEALAAGAADALLKADRAPPASLQYIISTLIRSQTVVYVVFAGPTGNVIATGEAEPGLLAGVLPPDGKKIQVEFLRTPRLIQLPQAGISCIDVVVPVFAGSSAEGGGHPQAIIGYLRLASDVTSSKARLAQIGNRMLRIAIGLLLLVIPCSLLLTRHIVAPLEEVAQAAAALARGAMDARVPVRSHNEIGQLAMAFNTMANRLTQSQMELLQLAAELEARVEERTRELAELASRDPLTGLYNRRHFSEVLRRQFAAAERYGTDLTCMMLDLDHFKEINDRHGHATGDAVLILLAQSIRSQLRSSDMAARFGGDEFIILLAQTPAHAAEALARRIVNEFASRVRNKFPELPIGLSIGLASLRQTEAPSSEALIKEADQALYAAKARGRNCIVEAAPSLPPHPPPTRTSSAAGDPSAWAGEI